MDRSVTGLIAQQQCVGGLHTPLADVGVIALSHDAFVGGATAIGEQPIKGLVDAGCGARMALGEALTNLVFADITDIKVGAWGYCYVHILRTLIVIYIYLHIQIYTQTHTYTHIFR